MAFFDEVCSSVELGGGGECTVYLAVDYLWAHVTDIQTCGCGPLFQLSKVEIMYPKDVLWKIKDMFCCVF